MKLLRGNGRTLEVFDVGDLRMKLRATHGIPIKFHGMRIMEDAEARVVVSNLMQQGASKMETDK